MAWPKLKNIIILLLLGVNLCLLAVLAGRELSASRIEGRALADAVAYLREQGVQVDEGQLPDAAALQPQNVSRDIQQEQALAAALLGGEVSAQARGAGVYRYYNSSGSVQFHSSGEFSAQFSDGAFPLGEREPQDHAGDILSRLGFQGELIARLGADGEESQSLTFRQIWQGIPLLNCQATLNYEGGSLVSITAGRRLFGQPQPDAAQAPITAATALMRFYTGLNALGDVCSQVNAVTQAYTVTATLADPAPLTPVWYIDTDTGAYQLDMLTGALSRAQ